jgi:hypothetical protein
MLRNSQYLEGCVIGAIDGPIGKVKGSVLRWRGVGHPPSRGIHGRLAFESKGFDLPVRDQPAAIGSRAIVRQITKAQVKNSPDIDKPISRQYEMQYLKYYRYPSYRGSTGLWGVTERYRQKTGRRQHDNPHLRSCNAVMKYHIRATDGDIGHVHALLVDDETWAIRYLIVETSNRWLGHQAPQWIDDVSWFDRKVSVDLTRQAVKDAPPYDAEVSLDREQEMGIHEHYGRPGYIGRAR